MATKAERFRSETSIERATKNAKTSPKRRAKAPAAAPKAHNLSARAARSARVVYEPSAGRPSRKSTRGSANHQRAQSELEHTRKLAESAPEARFARDARRATKVRGKPARRAS